jgi:response regulator of citrate/malate metabolism
LHRGKLESEVNKVTYDPEKVIRIATKLKAAREQVSVLEDQLRLLVLEQGQNGQASPRRRRQGLSEAATNVVQLFGKQPEKDFTAEEVWTALNLPETYARPLLSRLAKDNHIEKRGRGLYGSIKQDAVVLEQ